MNPLTPHQFRLPQSVSIYLGRQDFVVAHAAGKRVLHLGCVDQGLAEYKLAHGQYLHARLHAVCAELWGIDVDAEGIAWMKSQGWPNLYAGDIEDLAADSSFLPTQPFDLLVLSEVIEHLDNPGRFLQAIRPFFGPQTELLLTTPNAMRLDNILATLQGQEWVHPDHNSWYSYQTLHALLGKFGYIIRSVAVYTQTNYSRPLAGRLFKPPLQPVLPAAARPPAQAAAPTAGPRRRNPLGWLRVNALALLQGLLLRRNPFFADGLILLIQPTDLP